MEDFTSADGRYFYDAATEHPAYPMRFTARDLARFGWLYLNRGKWGDKQVVPAQWVAESTKSHSDAYPGLGYGYMWWVSKTGIQLGTHVGSGSFRAQGSDGQYVIVAPEPRIVVVHLNDVFLHRKMSSEEIGNLLQRIFAAAPR